MARFVEGTEDIPGIAGDAYQAINIDAIAYITEIEVAKDQRWLGIYFIGGGCFQIPVNSCLADQLRNEISHVIMGNPLDHN